MNTTHKVSGFALRPSSEVLRAHLVQIGAALIMAALVGYQSSAQTIKIVYTFTGANSGNSAFPGWVHLVQGRNGRLYGTTEGLTNGSVFDITTGGLFTNLFDFDHTDGGQAYAGVILGNDGKFYGTTFDGGSGDGGVFFELTTGGSYTILHDFTGAAGGSDGAYPVASLVEASNGNLYGTTEGYTGSNPISPTVYSYTRSGAFSTIYQFPSTVGQLVGAPLIQGNDGNLYGTTYAGGANGCGAVFKMTDAGVMLTVYAFPLPGSGGGCAPWGPLLQASDGNFYGTTSIGGTYGYGTIFKMTPAFSISTLYSFQGPAVDGEYPTAALVQATDGNLYGTTGVGGTNYGSLFQISTSGTFKLLYTFNAAFGEFPLGGLTQHTNGKLYGPVLTDGPGCACGQIYSLDMGLARFVTFARASGKVGQTAQILGQNLTGTTSVTFNGVNTTNFLVGTDTYIRAVIPSGATTGPVFVTTPNGVLRSNPDFRILP